MDIDTLIERQEVLVENQKQLLSAMVSTLDLMKAEKLRQEIDQEIAFDEPNKTVEQEEDPRVQKHKIIALKNGYTPEDVEEVASIYRSYYESLDEIEADLAAEGKPSNGSDYELRAENVRALRDQDLSYIDHKYEEQRKQKERNFRISKKDIHLILRRQTFLRKNIQSFLTVEFHLNFTEAAQIY